jgi:phosphoribosylformylglycinamidine cyclo-ligase
MSDRLSYSAAGVDIASADAAKRRMADSIDRGDPRVFNKVGAFASLVQGSFPTFADPVLVLKTEEPGS